MSEKTKRHYKGCMECGESGDYINQLEKRVKDLENGCIQTIKERDQYDARRRESIAKYEELRSRHQETIENLGKLKLCDGCVSANYATMIEAEQILLGEEKAPK